MIVNVWHLHYYNAPTKLKGIVVCDTPEQARDMIENLAKWEEAYSCFRVTGPHEHWIPE